MTKWVLKKFMYDFFLNKTSRILGSAFKIEKEEKYPVNLFSGLMCFKQKTERNFKKHSLLFEKNKFIWQSFSLIAAQVTEERV